jgi:hypothetical protein
MPRRAANPDPAIETRAHPKSGRVYEIRAYRSGTYEIWLDGKVVRVIGYARIDIHPYPSNRKQDEALRAARVYVDTMLE